MARIDSHQHFWHFDPEQHSWITPEMNVIKKDFLPSDLLPLLQESSIDGCVAVQVDQTAKETLTLLRFSEQYPFIEGVVGWIDLRATDVEDKLAYLSQYKKLKGFRHIVQAEPAGFLLQKEFLRGIGLLKQFNFTYDILIYPGQLEEATRFVKQFPEQRFVLDHLAKPFIASRVVEPWKTMFLHLATFENVYCKLSGMVTEADWHHWKMEDFTPYLDAALSSFGPTRLLYGSDWPVCTVAASYRDQLSLVEDHIGKLSSFEKECILGKNATQFYNL